MSVPLSASSVPDPGVPRDLPPLGPSAISALERWHSLLGALPLAAYLALHLVARALAFGDSALYRWHETLLRRHGWLGALEFALIALPLAAHAGIGIWFMLRTPARAPVSGMPPAARALGYVSALGLSAFLLVHLWQFQGRLWLGEIERADFPSELIAVLSSTAAGGIPLAALGYTMGLAAAAVHLGLGWYRVGLRWGLARPRIDRWFRPACVALGATVFLGGTLLVIALATGSLLLPSFR